MPIPSFVHESHAARVVFTGGAGQALPAELDRLGARRALILTTPEQADLGRSLTEGCGDRIAGLFSRAAMHVPIATAREAAAEAARVGADACLAVGGGSTTGLAKAIALETGLPILAIPTTYAGSEMTPLYGLTDAGEKRTGRDWRVAPRTVIYDPALTLTLPVPASVTSGLNAMAHAIEGLYAPDASPIHRLMAEEGIRAMASALLRLRRAADDLAVRSDALYAAWLCGTVLGSVQMGLHHKICHVLGGSFNLPHAETHAIILPYVVAYNASAAQAAYTALARALGVSDGLGGLVDLSRRLDIPPSLGAIGMPDHGLEHAARLITSAPYPNPASIEYARVLDLLRRAQVGQPPEPTSHTT